MGTTRGRLQWTARRVRLRSAPIPPTCKRGANVIKVKVVDATGLEAEITRNVVLDTTPPRIVEVIGVTDRVHVGAPFEIRVKVED